MSTALVYASEFGYTGIVGLLISHGVNLTGAALQRASRYGYEAVVRLLLDRGVDINTESRRDGTTLVEGVVVSVESKGYGTALQST